MKAAFAPFAAFDPSKHGRPLAVWALFVGALYCAVAFVTYVPAGYSGADAATANLGGPPGRVVAFAAVEAFGVGAFGFPFFLVFLGWRLRTRPAVGEPLLKALGLPLLMLTLGLLFQLVMPGRALARTDFPIGGVLGHWTADHLVSHFGAAWSLVAGAAGVAASLVLTTDTFLIEPFFPSVRRRRVATKPEAAPRVEKRKASKEDAEAARLAARRKAAAELEARTPGVAADATVDGEATGADASPRPRRARKSQAAEASADAGESAVATLVEEPSAPRTRRRGAASPPVEPADVDADDALDAAGDDEDDASEDPPPRPARRGRRPAAAEPSDVLEEEPTDDDEDALDPDDEPVPKQQELPFKPPKIRDLAQPSRADAGGVTVINLSRDPKLKGKEKYDLPPLTLTADPRPSLERESDEQLQAKARALMEALADFGVAAEVEEVVRGPVITRYDLKIERGVRISKVTSLAEDLAMALGVERVRIAQVKGKSALGVEIPNRYRETVWLREIALSMSEAQQKKIAIPLFLGKDSSGRPIIEDLASMPHLLIAGRTGAGKSVFVNSLILSVLMTRYPEEVRLIMIDPKKVELEVYQDVPHLLTRVESDPKKAQAILDWAVAQMEERYALLSCVGVRHLRDYNKMGRDARVELLKKHYSDGEIEKLPESLPYVVIIVDELADLMMASGKAVEQSIARLAQKARAVGIHVVVATQRPSVDVITGLIKANMPSRIAFQTKSAVDSRTILDSMGAEKLLDKGDMLYSSSATGDAPMRAQGPYVSDDEVHRVVEFLRKNAAPLYT
ncbi:MAG TPA: DNA translocase FtsK 4TM domain-containing protein, partial [Planctomycetota bacterium]|nr:DNA translocase FtsK 4TM domain-containing protein [Planctomycetota bacterium]